MPVTSLRKPSARPPEVAKIKIKIKSKSKSKSKSRGIAWVSGYSHFECTVIATNRTTTGLTINTQTNATGIANW